MNSKYNDKQPAAYKPKTAAAYYAEGQAQHRAGDHAAAVGSFSRCLEFEPEFVNGYLARGLAYDAHGDRDLALADFSQAVSLNPQRADAWRQRGRLHAANGEVELAQADFEQAIRLAPSVSQYRADLALLRAGQSDDPLAALAEMGDLLRADPDNLTILHQRATTYVAQGDHRRAIADLDRIIALAPSADAFRRRGDCYYALGQPRNAKVDYDTANQLEREAQGGR